MRKIKFSLFIMIMAFFMSGCSNSGHINPLSEECIEYISAVPTSSPVVEATETLEPVVWDQILEVHFIDVGQGDSTLLLSGEHAMLIDCGDTDHGTAVQNYLKKQGIDKLEYLILTHPDADHIGGAPVIITKFDIENIYMSDYVKDTKTYENVLNAMEYRNYSWSTPVPGDTLNFGTAEITFLAPQKTYEDPNNASIALIVKNGDNSFLFSGDAEQEAEKDILQSGISLDIDVYQAGHHGSRTSSSDAFLESMSPIYSVISCAEGNDYGHPHAETLNKFRSMGIQVFRTDEQGSIVANSDGKSITWNCSPSDTWKAGEPQGTTQKESVVAEESSANDITYVCNTNTMKFHFPDCESVSKMADKNRLDSMESRNVLLDQGYQPCGICKP